MKPPIRAVLVLLATVMVGCGRASSPTRPPAPDPGNALFACGSWSPQEPTVGVAVFDLHVPGADPRQAIRDAGGVILHEYGVPLLRVRLRVDAVRDLYGVRYLWSARQVSEDQPPQFDGIVGTSTPLSAADRDFLESVGVIVLQEYPGGVRFIRALIPDAAVPALRQYPGVSSVEVNSLACTQ